MIDLQERDTELAGIDAALAAAVEGSGQLMVVEGPAGAGKSALIAEAARRAAKRGFRVLQARGGEREQRFAFGTARQLVEPVLRTAGPTERTRLLAGPAAPAAWILPGTPPDARADGGLAVLTGLHRLVAELASEAPLLVAVDDLHWVDEPSLSWVDFLARRLGDLPVVLLAGVRSGEPGPHAAVTDALRDQPGTVVLTPGPLSPAGVGAVVRDVLPDADDTLADAYRSASAGNPFYLQELLRLGPLPAARVRDAAVPGVGDRVARRVARVDPAAPALAGAMAVLGDGAALADVAALAGVPVDAAAAVAHALRRVEILAAEDPVVFVHPVVRRSIYDALTSTQCTAAHRGAAALLQRAGAPAEASAAHLAVLPPIGDREVAARLADAAYEALGRAAPGLAVAWLQRALAENAPAPDRARLLYELGRAQMAIRTPAAAESLREARELATDPELLVRITVALVELLTAAGLWEEPSALIDETQETIGDAGELVVELEAMRSVLRSHDPRLVGGFDADRPRLLRLATGEGWAGRAIAATLASAAANRGEGAGAVLPLAEHAVADGVLLSRAAGGWSSAQLLGALLYVDAYDRLLELADAVTAAGRRSGSLLGVGTGQIFRTAVHIQRGELLDAEDELRRLIQVADDAEMPMWLITGVYLVVDAVIERPQLAQIVALADGVHIEPPFAATASGAMLREARGRFALARGDRDRAASELRGAALVDGPLGFGPARSPWRSELALAISGPSPDEAAALVQEELALARASGLGRPVGIALRAAGILAGGETGIALLRDAVAALAPTQARLELARTYVELGAALRRAQQRVEAREHLSTGLDLARRFGAVRTALRAEDELTVAGGRPRPQALARRDALTAGEARVARLAVAGRTNLEIADELYIGLKTVETHLSSVYAKLGLAGQGSRRRLEAALTERAG